jgi:hypothetical protein
LVVVGNSLIEVFSGLLYVSLIDNTNVIVVGLLMILTAPWGFLLMALAANIGFGPGDLDAQKLDAAFVVEYALGGLINAVILYLVVYLIVKAFRYFTSREL